MAPNPTVDLTTVAVARTFLGLTTTDADEELQRVVTAASRFFTSKTGRQLIAGSLTKTVDGNGSSTLILPEYPVTSVTSVTVDGETIPARTSITGDGWVLADADAGRLELLNYAFTEGIANVVVVFAAGYATIPEDIVQAVLELIAYRWKGKDRIGQASKQLPSAESVQFFGYAASTASVDAVIEIYRRPVYG